jgi:branched-subunit amino acid permease
LKKYNFAILIFCVAAIGIVLLGVLAVKKDKSNAMTFFHVVLPVFASWVGTILAFYYGRENFESANTQIREIIRKLTPE